MSDDRPKLGAMRIVTRCTTRDQFIAGYRGFCSARSCFIPTLAMRPVGVATAFSICLADGTPILRGRGVVLESCDTADNAFKRAGVHLGIHRLTADSLELFEALLASSPVANQLQPKATTATIAKPPSDAPRRARSTANPLLEITDDLLDAYIQCQLNETEAIPDDVMTAPTTPNAMPPIFSDAPELGEPIGSSPGRALLRPPRVHAAPSLVATELVDRIDHDRRLKR